MQQPMGGMGMQQPMYGQQPMGMGMQQPMGMGMQQPMGMGGMRPPMGACGQMPMGGAPMQMGAQPMGQMGGMPMGGAMGGGDHWWPAEAIQHTRAAVAVSQYFARWQGGNPPGPARDRSHPRAHLRLTDERRPCGRLTRAVSVRVSAGQFLRRPMPRVDAPVRVGRGGVERPRLQGAHHEQRDGARLPADLHQGRRGGRVHRAAAAWLRTRARRACDQNENTHRTPSQRTL